MSFARNPSRTRFLVAAFAVVVAAFAGTAAHAQSPAASRGAVLTELRSGFLSGERVGVLQSGPNCQEQIERGWSELLAQRVEVELPRAFEQEMSRSGGLAATASAGAQPLRVQAFVNKLDIHVCQAPSAMWKGGFQVQVGWQVMSADGSQVLYRASTEGSYTIDEPQRMQTSDALREAFVVAVRQLVAEPRFASLLKPQDAPAISIAYQGAETP
jgi:hypothetical protein